jgi:hypothetical protein
MLKIKRPATIQEVFVYLWFFHASLLFTILLCAVIVFRLMPATNHGPASKSVLLALVAFSLYSLVVGGSVRSKRIKHAFEKLRVTPSDQTSLDMWRRGQINGAFSAESVSACGALLHFVGGSNFEVASFLVVGGLAMLVWSPRKP